MAFEEVDVLILGAGGAGMMCAIQAGKRGRKVLVLDHSPKLGGKILISGGGRCNFTNTGASPLNYVSTNPHFCKSAMSRFTPEDFIRMVEAHGIAYHEKKLGQLFCDDSARSIVEMLRKECEEAGARIELGCKIEEVRSEGERRFRVTSSRGEISAESLVVATGGLSLPKIGATGFGYELARQFGLAVTELAPALDGFTFDPENTERFRSLAGVSVDCVMTAGGKSFRENLLFTHAGMSGPAALQVSLHWRPGEPVTINLVPEKDASQFLLEKKKEGSRALMRNLLSELLPARFAELFTALYWPSEAPLSQATDRALESLGQKLHSWQLHPSGTVGYSKAEVTRGGVDPSELSSKTLESKRVPGLYFIGEVVDVTGWLGGYNFQWAWASGWAAGSVV